MPLQTSCRFHHIVYLRCPSFYQRARSATPAWLLQLAARYSEIHNLNAHCTTNTKLTLPKPSTITSQSSWKLITYLHGYDPILNCPFKLSSLQGTSYQGLVWQVAASTHSLPRNLTTITINTSKTLYNTLAKKLH